MCSTGNNEYEQIRQSSKSPSSESSLEASVIGVSQTVLTFTPQTQRHISPEEEEKIARYKANSWIESNEDLVSFVL